MSTSTILLAGPIIRRVEKSKVCVWIATSKPVDASLKVFSFNQVNENAIRNDGDTDNDTADQPKSVNESQPQQMHLIGYGINSPLKLGDNLYVNLIIARPSFSDGTKESSEQLNRLNFPTGELLAYDIELLLSKENKEKVLCLKDLGLLSGEDTILYQGEPTTTITVPFTDDGDVRKKSMHITLPTFFLPEEEKEQKLNVLYGSCRKLHGADGDSLTIGDQLVSSTLTDLKSRPSTLFLMGDQIYADDVATPLIKHLTGLANELLGWEEPINGINKKLKDVEIGERKQLLDSNAKFTSEVSDNHLVSFGEFVAMYLVTWNRQNWPSSLDEHSVKALKNSKEKENYYSQIKSLEQSRKNLSAIRRLFANIPTYMICDDHEITDDWNIDRKWHDSVKQSNCGSQIIANGLVAYWAFQAWGNDPDSFDENFIELIKNYLQLRRKLSIYQSSEEGVSQNNIENDSNTQANNMQMLEDKIWNSRKWIFIAPTNPFSIFLDCRTQRGFVKPDGPPMLLDDEALAFIKSAVQRSKYNKGDPLIIVSPTPVFGFELAESVQRFLTSISGTYKWDMETWRANESGFIKFLSFIAENFSPRYCIFLSGDVHYAFTMKAKFDLYKYENGKKDIKEKEENKTICTSLDIAQLTSSPFRSNSLIKRIIAIHILNLVHKVLITKNMSRLGFNKVKENIFYNTSDTTYNPIHTNSVNKIYNFISQILSQKKRNYPIVSQKTSLYAKIKNGSSKLFYGYISKDHVNNITRLPDWSESRLLVKPVGHGSTPVLANNNIGLMTLDIKSQKVRNKLYFFDKENIRFSEANLQFEGQNDNS